MLLLNTKKPIKLLLETKSEKHQQQKHIIPLFIYIITCQSVFSHILYKFLGQISFSIKKYIYFFN